MKMIISAALLAVMTGVSSALPVVIDTTGKVSYKTAAATDWSAARPGQQVGEGARLKTGFVSAAQLRFDDGSLVSLGPDTELAVYTIKETEYFTRLFDGFLKAMVKNTGRKFAVKTAAGMISVPKAARFTLASAKSGTVRLAVFNGIANYSGMDGKEVPVQAEMALAGDSTGLGKAERYAPAVIDNGWHLAPPYGFSVKGKSRWEMRYTEAAGFDHKGLAVEVEHQEVFYAAVRELKWRPGKPWPAKCPSGEAPKDLRQLSVEGGPMFAYSCPAADLSGHNWQNRYYELPQVIDGAAASAVSLGYAHRAQAKVPPAAELKRLYGSYARCQAELMPKIAAVTPRSRLDGVGFSSVLESLQTLYQESWGKKAETYTGKVVGLIE